MEEIFICFYIKTVYFYFKNKHVQGKALNVIYYWAYLIMLSDTW